MIWAKITPVPVHVKDGVAEIQCAGLNNKNIVVLAIYGPDVVSRVINEGDPIIRRIMHNDSLLWAQGSAKVFYVPRETVCKTFASLNGAYVVDTVIGGSKEDVEAEAARRAAKLGKWNEIISNRPLLNCVAGQWCHRLLLPVLLFWLLVLSLNYIVSLDLGRRVSEAQMQSRFNRQATEQAVALSAQQERMLSEYKSLALPVSSSSIDYIASLLPDGMNLSNLAVMRQGLCLKGKAERVQSVVSFAARMSDASWDVEVRSLDEHPEKDHYDFEIMLSR